MRRCFGFTLIELMISIVVMSLILCFVMPFYRVNQASTAESFFKDELIVFLTTAKLQAFLTRMPLVLEPWEQGPDGVWKKGLRLRTGNGTIRAQWRWPSTQVPVRWFGFQGRDKIWISPHPQQLAMNGYFEIGQVRLIVNRFGRIRKS